MNITPSAVCRREGVKAFSGRVFHNYNERSDKNGCDTLEVILRFILRVIF